MARRSACRKMCSTMFIGMSLSRHRGCPRIAGAVVCDHRGGDAGGFAGGEAGADDPDRRLRFVAAGNAAAGHQTVRMVAQTQRAQRHLAWAAIGRVAQARAGDSSRAVPSAMSPARRHPRRSRRVRGRIVSTPRSTDDATTFANANTGWQFGDVATLETVHLCPQKISERPRELAAFGISSAATQAGSVGS